MGPSNSVLPVIKGAIGVNRVYLGDLCCKRSKSGKSMGGAISPLIYRTDQTLQGSWFVSSLQGQSPEPASCFQ